MTAFATLQKSTNPLTSYMSGLNKTYDTTSMIEASVTAAKAPLGRLQSQATDVQAKISALGKFSGKLDAMNTAAAAFSGATDKAAAIQKFVDSYNDMVKTGKSLVGTVGAAGPLTGDSALRNSSMSLSKETMSSFGGMSLSALGITHEKDGTLKFDATKFDAATETDAAQAFMTDMQTLTTKLTGDEGFISSREDTLNKKLAGLQVEAEKVNTRAENMRATLQKAYAQVDSMQAWMSNMTSMFGAYSNNKSS